MIQERKPPRFKSDEKIQGLMMENETNIAKKKKGKTIIINGRIFKKGVQCEFWRIKALSDEKK